MACLIMSIGFGCLPAHSGPPLAASQGNSRATTLRSLSASVTRVVLSGPCPSPRIGPRRQGYASPLRALDCSGPIRKTRCLRGEGGGSGRGARSGATIEVVLDDASIKDTVIHGTAGSLESLPATLSASGLC